METLATTRDDLFLLYIFESLKSHRKAKARPRLEPDYSLKIKKIAHLSEEDQKLYWSLVHNWDQNLARKKLEELQSSFSNADDLELEEMAYSIRERFQTQLFLQERSNTTQISGIEQDYVPVPIPIKAQREVMQVHQMRRY